VYKGVDGAAVDGQEGVEEGCSRKLTKLSSPAGLAVLTLASHVSGQGSIPGGHR